MQLAIDALVLFMRSLPKDAVFSIISFGSKLRTMCYDNSESMPYNDGTMYEALH